jgi:signal transduction histidine kinase/ActR/RegA family two-component response regulator
MSSRDGNSSQSNRSSRMGVGPPAMLSESLCFRLRRASLVCAVLAAAVSASALIGWVAHVGVLTRVAPSLPPIKANAAVGYLLVSVSLVAYSRSAPGGRLRRVAGIGAAIAALIGAATLAEYVFGWKLGIDQLLFTDRVDPNAPYPGRPAANAAIGLVLLGASLLCWDVRLRRWWVCNLLAWLAAAVGLLAVFGYATGAESLITLTSRQHISLSSAILLSLLPFAVLLARPERGEIAILASDSQAGVALRRLLPAAIALPASLALATLAGHRLGLFSATVEDWLFASTVTLAFIAVAWLIANALGRAESERERAERARGQALAELQQAQQVASLGSWYWDQRTDEVTWSAQMYAIIGRDPARGPPSMEELLAYVHPEDRLRVEDASARALSGRVAFELECRIIAGDGIERTVHAIAREDPARSGCYLGTVQDVTRQRRAERERLELIETAARAESANRAKSEFLARMSHELRTPLNSIIGFSQVLELEGLPPRQSEDIGHILRAGNHLLALVNEVLDLARIESGQMAISPEPVALADLVEEVLALVAPLARERDITLDSNTDGLAGDGHVHADRQRLEQVLLNVLSNAIKYNRPGGRVDVSLTLIDASRVRATIADTGIGIAPEQLAQVFEPFERLGAELTQVEGTGLGLALARGLLEAMGGTIEVVSELGTGTTVTIELASAQQPEHTPGPDDRQPAELEGPDDKRQVILYIEDNLSNLTLVERILQRHSVVELIPAMQATIGLELARQHRPDLIILDLHLPDMPGAELLKRLKAEPATREIPVVVLTADASKTQAELVTALGVAEYLTKPLDVPNFLTVIADNLARQPSPQP